jgi:hypothetical protein
MASADELWTVVQPSLPFDSDNLQALSVAFFPPHFVPDNRMAVQVYFISAAGFCQVNASLTQLVECRTSAT